MIRTTGENPYTAPDSLGEGLVDGDIERSIAQLKGIGLCMRVLGYAGVLACLQSGRATWKLWTSEYFFPDTRDVASAFISLLALGMFGLAALQCSYAVSRARTHRRQADLDRVLRRLRHVWRCFALLGLVSLLFTAIGVFEAAQEKITEETGQTE